MKNVINYLSKFAPDNGSGMTRKWFGNDSGMTRFSLASLICLCLLTVGSGNAWGKEGDNLYSGDFTTVSAHGYTQNKTFTLSSKGFKSSVSQVNSSVFYLGCNSTNATKGVLNNNSDFSTVVTALASENATYNSNKTTAHAYALLFNNSYSTVGKITFSWAGANGAGTAYIFADSGSGWAKIASASVTNGTSTSGNVEYTNNTAGGFSFNSLVLVFLPNANSKTLRLTTLVIKEGKAAGGGCDNTVTLNTGSATNGTISYASSVATCSATDDDRNVTISVAPSSGYTLLSSTRLTFNKTSGTATASYVNGPTWNGSTSKYEYIYRFARNDKGAGSFSVTCDAIPRYTVSFNTGTSNPTQANIQEASAGSGITLPAGPTPTCSGDGWSFAGWKETSAVTSETTEAPTLLSAGSTFHPSENVTLYAVYQKEDLSTDYEKITSSAALTSGSNYVVARGTAWGLDANKYTMSSNDGYFGVTAISVSENVISNPNADLIWQISGDNTDGYSLYNSNRNLYIGYSTTYHDLYADGTRHRDYTITFTSSNFYIKSKSESSYYFSTWSYSLQGGGSAYFFEIDNSSAYVVLYKQKGTNTYFSNPTCCTPLGSINGSINFETVFEPVSPFVQPHKQTRTFPEPIPYPTSPYIYYVYIP